MTSRLCISVRSPALSLPHKWPCLPTAATPAAIPDAQLNCAFIQHRTTQRSPAHGRDGSLNNAICLGLNLGVCNLIQLIFKPKLSRLIAWQSSAQNVCTAAKKFHIKIVCDGICFFLIKSLNVH
uniref:Uncharacterized protein n=1 Tax=Pipistrellus kuhlii TaxID=59472 RepID=A0A7J8B1N0_PIPKU|nr:hypothetical protein mPipKuh1_007901 [Pipistrellus kuhlii]